MTSPILQNVATSRMIFISNGYVWSIRTRATIGPRTEKILRTPTVSRASALFKSVAVIPFGNWMAALPPQVGVMARALSNTPNLFARPGPLLLRRGDGTAGTMNLFGAFKALRSLSFRSLVHDTNQPTRGLFQRFSISKVLLLPALHGTHHDSRRDVNGQISVGEFRNVIR